MECGRVKYDLPAGRIDPGESPQEAAARELEAGEQNLDQFEDVQVIKMPFPEAVALVTSGGVIDGSLMLGLLLVAQRDLAA